MQSARRVVITAAGSGIGLEIARAFAADGARVHICDIDEDALHAVTGSEHQVTSTVCDVSDRAAVERFVEAAAETLGGIDVLVNNAGISDPTAPVEDMDPDAWDTVMSVNLSR